MPAVDDPKWRDDERKGAPVVTLHTTHGDVTVELYYKHAPRTCENFFELAKRGYYDGTIFHRVIAEFMIQGGDPTGTGRGGGERVRRDVRGRDKPRAEARGGGDFGDGE